MGEVEVGTPDIRQTTEEEEKEHGQGKMDWWARLAAYGLLIIVGESSSTMLERLYFIGGGSNIFLAAVLENVGFPILLPISIYCWSRKTGDGPSKSNKKVMAAIYAFLGLFQAACNILYSIGIKQLPASTYSLITATQLGFNAFFAFFLNSEKLTPPTLNAIFLLTISSALLVFRHDPGEGGAGNTVVGFSCTLAASALHALSLSLTQLIFNKMAMKETFSSVLDLVVFESIVATCALLLPLTVAQQWGVVVREMGTFRYGRGAYLVVIAATAVGSQLRAIGSMGLILEVSSLCSNVIATVGIPIVPVLGAVFFHERMDGMKVISIVLAVWGFASYIYQHYFLSRQLSDTESP